MKDVPRFGDSPQNEGLLRDMNACCSAVQPKIR